MKKMVERLGTMVPRRICTDLYTPLETTLSESEAAIEAAGAHPLLTDALLLCKQAREKVADWVDLQPDAPTT